MQALVGHRFPGGTYRIAHWENFLLSDATGAAPPPDGLAHPVNLFHVAINGVGTSIQSLFDLAQSPPGAPVSIAYYDWRIHRPLREDAEYRLAGGITSFARTQGDDGPVRDAFDYAITLTSGDGGARGRGRLRLELLAASLGRRRRVRVAVGDEIPPFEMDPVSPERMKTVAAIFRDPFPVHWDREATRAMGFEGRLLNQSPINLGYVLNAVAAWAGPTALRRVRTEFPHPVFDGDAVRASGRVVGIAEEDGETVAECELWLDRQDGVRSVEARAWVAVPRAGDD